MAKMGLSMRDDPVRVIDVGARQWGEPANGFVLSVESVVLKEDRGVLSNLSVVLRNISAETRSLVVPGWMFFLHVELTGPDGNPVPMSPFGRELLRPERRTEKIPVTLAPGAHVETQIPIGSFFDMRARGVYHVVVWCEPAGGSAVRSNSLAIPV
jgi:hypothetical protein